MVLHCIGKYLLEFEAVASGLVQQAGACKGWGEGLARASSGGGANPEVAQASTETSTFYHS